MKNISFGNDLFLPPIFFGTSSLGNQYQELSYSSKLEMTKQWVKESSETVVLDSAGKYGAGLSLEMIGKTLRDLNVSPDKVVISNKLGWKRVELKTEEPTFEPGGTWVGLEYDAIQDISYQGILDCHAQGCELLGDPYKPKLLSVHDPDEYLAKAKSAEERASLFNDIKGAYKALEELKEKGEVKGIGVGSKDWRIIKEISSEVDLDWVMFACSLTPYTHDDELVEFIAELHRKQVSMINSAVFNAGFLLGGEFFDYRIPDPIKDVELFSWREKFHSICKKYYESPSEVCIQFGMKFPGIVATALNSSKPNRISGHVKAIEAQISNDLWKELYDEKLIKVDVSQY